jgi:hypothetical protein
MCTIGESTTILSGFNEAQVSGASGELKPVSRIIPIAERIGMRLRFQELPAN